jgi:hypothetical protein
VSAPSELREDPDRKPEVGIVLLFVLAKHSFRDGCDVSIEPHQKRRVVVFTLFALPVPSGIIDDARNNVIGRRRTTT